MKYDFSRHSDLVRLSARLNETSALCYSGIKDQLYTVNDEKGTLYTIDATTGEILDQFRFGKNRDYEGITTWKDKIAVTKSNGNLVVVNASTHKEAYEIKVENLSSKHDIEGLCYDAKLNKLLLASKGKGADRSKKLYAIDPDKSLQYAQEYLSINIIDEIDKLESTEPLNSLTTDIINKRLRAFAPSGLAIHPITSELYVLSARSTSIAIYDSNLGIAACILLDANTHEQPEGICFDTLGNLYISNEARTNSANVVKYDYK